VLHFPERCDDAHPPAEAPPNHLEKVDGVTRSFPFPTIDGLGSATGHPIAVAIMVAATHHRRPTRYTTLNKAPRSRRSVAACLSSLTISASTAAIANIVVFSASVFVWTDFHNVAETQ
jgi:hypothetical protein